MEYLTKRAEETTKLGEKLAKKILKTKKESAFVLGLVGELGGGKTTFLQGFAKGLGVREKILSPTFVIMKKFSIFNLQFSNFYHIDCYRIEKSKEILNLGFKEIISSPQNIVAIEWAEKIRKILPKDALIIEFEFISKQERKITIENEQIRMKQWLKKD